MPETVKIDRRQALALGVGAAAMAGQAASAQTAASAIEGPDLSGKSILVTGASSGFGRLGVEYYARLGAKVFATMRNVPRVEADDLRDLAESESLDLSVIESSHHADGGVAVADGVAAECTTCADKRRPTASHRDDAVHRDSRLP